MDLISNPLHNGLLALNINGSIKFVQLQLPIKPTNAILTRNDFTLTPASVPDLPQHVDSHNVNCMTWCCLGQNSTTPDSLAVGMENGNVYVAWPSLSGTPASTNSVVLYQGPKACKALSWNKLQPEYLAMGFDRFRSEGSLVIANLHYERPKKDQVSGLLDGKAKLESCSSESVNSIMWTHKDPKSFVAGVNGKYLRLYDMRSIRSPSQFINTKSVFGLCQDPCLDSRFASFVENQICIWDLRSFSKPAAVITTKQTIVKTDWCHTRSGLLATVSTGSDEGDTVYIYDTSHTVVTDSDSDIAYRHVEQVVRLPLSPEEKIGAISWLKNSENQFITVTTSGAIHRTSVPERISVCWSDRYELVSASNNMHRFFKKRNDTSEVINLPGIEQIMYERSKNGYGLDDKKDNSSNLVNLETDNASLSLFWKWIKMAKANSVTKAVTPVMAHGGRPSWGRSSSSNSIVSTRFCGLQNELKQTNSRNVTVSWIGVPNSSCNIHSSSQRNRALIMCDWLGVERLRTNPSEFRASLFKSNNVERAAVLALWHLDMSLAIDILKQHGSGDSAVQYSVVAMAISGYAGNGATPLWKEMCDSLQRNMPNPYLRAGFSFLKALKEPKIDFGSVLRMRELSVSDRIAFACTYLNDESLAAVMDELSDDAAKHGHLDGIIATGLTTELGIELLQHYIEKTKDVQTAALGLIQGGSADIIRNQTADFIIESYRKLLDSWQLWKERAWFDAAFGKPISIQKSKHSFQGVSIQCNFCGKGIMHAKIPDIRSRGIKIQGSSNSSKPTSCPKCRKALPRCSVCCMGLGTTPADNENGDIFRESIILENSFTWCPFCQHGGHRQHLKEWFKEHRDCPVSGCVCDCGNSQS